MNLSANVAISWHHLKNVQIKSEKLSSRTFKTENSGDNCWLIFFVKLPLFVCCILAGIFFFIDVVDKFLVEKTLTRHLNVPSVEWKFISKV